MEKELTLEEHAQVIAKNKPEYGVGVVENIDEEEGLTYVWYDEVETLVHYTKKEINEYLEKL